MKNFKSQIYAYRYENISIHGDGHLEGQGQKWWDFMKVYLRISKSTISGRRYSEGKMLNFDKRHLH